MVRNLGMILKEEFKEKVKAILELQLIVQIKNIGFVQSNLFKNCLHFLLSRQTQNLKFQT
jgi:hypothetical protein